MSDIILGIIIGGGIGVVASIVGGIFSYLVAKSQINARRQEQADQFANRKQEFQMDRLIEARKAWLEPLSKAIQECVKEVAEAEAITLKLKASCNIHFWGEDLYGQSSKALVKSTKSIIKICREVRDLTAQVSDGSLNKLISDMILLPFEIHTKVFTLPGSDTKQWLTKTPVDKEEESISTSCVAICEILNNIREHSWKINKRIEELLSGVD